jgi:hypothetical protein
MRIIEQEKDLKDNLINISNLKYKTPRKSK